MKPNPLTPKNFPEKFLQIQKKFYKFKKFFQDTSTKIFIKHRTRYL
jgi:hypothetical protein